MLAIPTLYVQRSGFRRQGGSADNDSGNADEVGDVCRVKISDGNLGDGGAEEQLVLGDVDDIGFL